MLDSLSYIPFNGISGRNEFKTFYKLLALQAEILEYLKFWKLNMSYVESENPF